VPAESSGSTEAAKQEPPRVIPKLGLDKLVKSEPDEFPAQEDDAMSAESSESTEAAAKQEPPRVIPKLGLDKLPKFESDAQAGFPAEQKAVAEEPTENTQEEEAKQEPTNGAAAIAGEARQVSWQAEKATRRPSDELRHPPRGSMSEEQARSSEEDAREAEIAAERLAQLRETARRNAEKEAEETRRKHEEEEAQARRAAEDDWASWLLGGVPEEEEEEDEQDAQASKFSVDMRYIRTRTEDPTIMRSARGPRKSDAFVPPSRKSVDGRWLVQEFAIATPRGPPTQPSQSISTPRGPMDIRGDSTGMAKKVDGKWEVRTDYIKHRTNDTQRLSHNDAVPEEDSCSSSDEEPSPYADPATTVYTLEELSSLESHVCPDPTCREMYLSDSDFARLFKMDKQDFSKLPKWKKLQLKKGVGIF